MNTIPLQQRPPISDKESLERVIHFHQLMNQRRSVRQFSNRPVDRAVIESAILTAGTAPSGANLQPWHFVAISDQQVKHSIRLAAEDEEKDFYAHRAPPEWLAVLEPIGTDANKPFLEIAPWLIACFVQTHSLRDDGLVQKHYYAVESVGIAVGMLITSLHQAGLVTLTHTPSPMKFLNTLLHRGANERPFLLLVVGHPSSDAVVPDIHRKTLERISTFIS